MAYHVVIADDNPVVQDVLADILESCELEFNITLASDGDEVLEAVKKNQPPIDLVILDIVMPNREGLETLCEIKEKSQQIKVIAITGKSYSSGFDNLKAAEAFGADHTLKKPFSREQLLTAIREIFAI